MVWCPGESGDQPVSCVEIDTKVVLLREKILPARWRSVGNGKKFSLLAGNGRISVFLGVLGEFCTGWVRWWVLLGEFCTGWARGGCCWESFVPGAGSCPGRSALSGAYWGGFCTGWGGGVPVMGVGNGRKFSLLGGAVLGTGKILPARGKWPDFGVFGCAGRVLYRLGPVVGVAGRVLYRVSGGLVLEAGENSPCSVAWWWNREKVLPAREKWPDFVDFGCAGRVLYRLCLVAGVAGRVLYRVSGGLVLLREKILPARWRSVGNGKKFSLLAGNGRISVFLGVLGEFCTGWARAWGSLGAGLLCGAPLARKLADDGLLFGHADDAGALAQG